MNFKTLGINNYYNKKSYYIFNIKTIRNYSLNKYIVKMCFNQSIFCF
jgi:hypothetical protein